MPRFASAQAHGDEEKVAAPWWAKDEHGEAIEYVVLKPTKTFLGTMRASAAGMTTETAQALVDGSGTVDAAAIQKAMMREMVVRMTDEAGADVPVTDEALESLDEQDGAFIVGEIDKRSRDIVPAFRSPGRGPLAADQQATQELPPGDSAPEREVAADRLRVGAKRLSQGRARGDG